MAIKFDDLLEALDLDNKEFIPTGLRDDRAKDVLDSVIGQLSDGIWEDSPAMNKYWKYAHIDFIDGEINIVIDNSWGSGFKGKSPEEIKKWFARKVKQIIKEEGLDWKRGNEKFVDYMHGDVTVRDAYRVYDKLLGRIDRITESLDSMWIIIPAERRYDDLTSSDYDKFVRKYGTFNSRQECWDKIDELAPDRWDAFIPLRIDGDDSLSEDYTGTQSRTDKIIDFLAEHDQAWEDCCNYFGLDPWDEDALLKVNPTDLEDWIAEHDQLYSDLKNSLNESMSKEESRAKSLIINYLKRNSQPQVASLLNDFEFVLTKDPNITCVVDSDRKQITLNRNLSTDDAVLYILEPFRKKNLKDPKFIQWLKDTNKEAEKYMHYNESLNEAFDPIIHASKISFDIEYIGDGNEDDAISYIEEIANAFEWELENGYDDIKLLGSDIEDMTEVYQQQYGSLTESMNQVNLGPYSKYYKFIGIQGFGDYTDDILDVVEGNYGMEFLGWAEAKPEYIDRLMDDGNDYALVVKDPDGSNIQLVSWINDRLYPIDTSELEGMLDESYKRINESVKSKKLPIRKLLNDNDIMSMLNKDPQGALRKATELVANCSDISEKDKLNFKKAVGAGPFNKRLSALTTYFYNVPKAGK